MAEYEYESKAKAGPSPTRMKADGVEGMRPHLREAAIKMYGGVHEVEREIRIRGAYLVEQTVQLKLEDEYKARAAAASGICEPETDDKRPPMTLAVDGPASVSETVSVAETSGAVLAATGEARVKPRASAQSATEPAGHVSKVDKPKRHLKEKAHPQKHEEEHGPLRLQTALDSSVQVRKAAENSYVASLPFGASGAAMPFATYKLIDPSASVQQLPIYIEDVITDATAIVRIKYDPKQVQVQQMPIDGLLGGHKVSVQLVATTSDQLLVDKAPLARAFGDGRYTVESSEKITQHSSGSTVDKIAGSIASAEGGFGSTEASDSGIFTWGQGQWIVTNGELQLVLGFIKAAREDLFDKYWGALSLDVEGKSFIFAGDRYPPNKKDMLALFRPSAARNKLWTDVFSQAGMDPQIQRLQRAYIRHEVKSVLAARIGEKREKHKAVEAGHKPSDWLTTRGQALYYSMHKNLPHWADEYFKTAVKAAGGTGDAGHVAEHQREAATVSLEESFKDSKVIARDGNRHHIMSFWGEGGRKQALAECDAHIADSSKDKTWKKEQWEKHKSDMEKRQSRYQKTATDITAALNHQDVEPDVPADMGEDQHGTAVAQSRHSGGAQSAVAKESNDPELLVRRERGTVEAGQTAWHYLRSLGEGQAEASKDPSAGYGSTKNSGTGVISSASQHDPEAKSEQRHNTPAPDGGAPAQAVAIEAGQFAKLVADLHNAQVTKVAQDVDALVAKSKEMRTSAPKNHDEKSALRNEVRAAGRQELLASIQTIHTEVANLDQTGLAPSKLVPIKGRMFRTLQELSPYHSQGRNINILETNPEVHSGNQATRTCNVTSLSMALEGLGRSANDYANRKRHQVIAVAKYFQEIVGTAELTVDSSAGWDAMTGLRLPDFMELAAIAEVLGDGKDDPAAIKAAATQAYERILNIDFLKRLAERFGVQAQIKFFSYDGKQTHTVHGKGGKTHEAVGTVEADRLASATKNQRHIMEDLINKRNKAEALVNGDPAKYKAAKDAYHAAKVKAEELLSGDAVERRLPLETYKKAVKDQVGAELDSGAAIQTHVVQHFVRLHAIEDDYVVIDDPSRPERAHKKVLWEEARASALFDKRLVLR